MKRLLSAAICLCLVLSGCTSSANLAASPSASPLPSDIPTAQSELHPQADTPTLSPDPSRLLGSGTIQYEDGVAPLSKEQEAAILAYMTAAYEALARLEEPDFSTLFTNQAQAQASQSGIILQIGLRTLIDEVDYSLTGYSYTLNCGQTVWREDGTVEMNALETCVQNFAQFPGVDSERGRNFHHFVLEETAEGWLIQEHMQYDILYGQLMESEYNWRGDFSQAYVDAMPAYLESLRAAHAARESQRGAALELPQADEPYNREAALAYADQYAMDRNPEWADFSSSGGNCQNYVSQCLLAGGIPVDPYGDAVWTYGSGEYQRSTSWAGVISFLRYARNNTGFGLVSLPDAPYYSGQPGDLIQMGTEESWHHVVIIRDVVTDEAGNPIDYLINSNTNDMSSYPASLYGYPVFSLTRVIGWNYG